MFTGFFESVPLWALFLATAALALLAVESGFQLGLWRRRRADIKDPSPVGSMVAAALALLAFVLAFTYGAATTNFSNRQQLVVDDANAIGSTYTLAELLPEPQSTQIRNLLKEYVTLRANGIQPATIQTLITRSEELQDQIWSQTAALKKQTPASISDGLFIESLNQMIAVHVKRVAEARLHVLPTIWLALYFVAVTSMVVLGYQSGLTGKRSLLAVVTFILAFSAVLVLIADFDRPASGTLNVSQQPMIDLFHRLIP